MFEESRQGAVSLITGLGPISNQTVEELEPILQRQLSTGQPRVVLNMERVPLIDGRGIEVLVDTQKACVARGGSLKLASPNSLCTDLLEATGIMPQFEVFDNVLNAAGSFAR